MNYYYIMHENKKTRGQAFGTITLKLPITSTMELLKMSKVCKHFACTIHFPLTFSGVELHCQRKFENGTRKYEI